MVMRSDGMRRVLNHEQPVAAREFPDRVHVTRQSPQVHGHDRSCPRRDPVRDRLRIDVAVGPDVGEHRRGADVEDGVDRRTEGEWGRDYLVAQADVQSSEREVKSGGGGNSMPVRGPRRRTPRIRLKLRGSSAESSTIRNGASRRPRRSHRFFDSWVD